MGIFSRMKEILSTLLDKGQETNLRLILLPVQRCREL